MHRQQDNPFGILMYHRVTPAIAGSPKPTWNVAPNVFGSSWKGSSRGDIGPGRCGGQLPAARRVEPIPPRTFVVTFDDGYESVYRNAWPILKELSVPATVFIVTAYLDTERAVCRSTIGSRRARPACRPTTWRPLSTAQCAEMARQGLVEMGSHTHTHADFRGRPGSLSPRPDALAGGAGRLVRRGTRDLRVSLWPLRR